MAHTLADMTHIRFLIWRTPSVIWRTPSLIWQFSSLGVLASESYSRAHGSLVKAQQLAELEVRLNPDEP